ncbi:hypothetical protein K438DRAFT_1781409 [Mycena galopus ATCC 62051]|nr:hypothetical protein K438DRAFT_1781409 [Mycena galopus ATCC 62051]
MCGDLEEYMVNSTAEHIKTNGWNAEATVADAQALPFPENHFSHNLMNFGIRVIPDQPLAMKGWVHTDYLVRRYMWEVFKMVLMGEVGEKYDAYMREKYGEGDFTLTWEVFVITAEKS